MPTSWGMWSSAGSGVLPENLQGRDVSAATEKVGMNYRAMWKNKAVTKL